MGKVTLKQINQALADRGVAERLVKGKGYFYFWDGDAPDWKNTSVMVYRLNQLTLDQWLQEYDRAERGERQEMKVTIEYDTSRNHEVTICAEGATILLARDHQGCWRRNNMWVANANATALDAARCLIHSLLPPHER